MARGTARDSGHVHGSCSRWRRGHGEVVRQRLPRAGGIDVALPQLAAPIAPHHHHHLAARGVRPVRPIQQRDEAGRCQVRQVLHEIVLLITAAGCSTSTSTSTRGLWRQRLHTCGISQHVIEHVVKGKELQVGGQRQGTHEGAVVAFVCVCRRIYGTETCQRTRARIHTIRLAVANSSSKASRLTYLVCRYMNTKRR